MFEECNNSNELHILRSKISQCSRCNKLVATRNTIVQGYGDTKAKIMFIGEAPGRLGADITGVPFTKDRSGILLQTILKKLGFSLSHPTSTHPILKGVYLTNVVRCNPRTKNINRSPNSDEINNCKEFLEEEIRIINPILIIPLGLTALRMILGDKFTGQDFGNIVKKDHKLYFPLWHPAYIIRGGGKDKITEEIYFKYFRTIIKHTEGMF